jgi:hypothetical protein
VPANCLTPLLQLELGGMLRTFLLLTVTSLILVLNVNTLRPLAFLTQGSKICCLECKKNFCPMMKTSRESAPACHMSQQKDQLKMKQTCNHTNTEHLFFYNAILISFLFIVGYLVEIRRRISALKIEFPDFQPATPPPRFA